MVTCCERSQVFQMTDLQHARRCLAAATVRPSRGPFRSMCPVPGDRSIRRRSPAVFLAGLAVLGYTRRWGTDQRDGKAKAALVAQSPLT